MPVVLLCHCDGTNGSTTFTDVSLSAHTLTATNATVSTTSPKFGTGSAVFMASSDARIVVGGSAADFNLGAGQFTIEAWAYFMTAPTGFQSVAAQFGGVSSLGWFLGTNSSTFNFYYSTTGTDNPNIGAAFSPTLNQWYHLAVDRDAANVIRVYVNGAVIASATVASTIFPSVQACVVGNDNNNTRYFPGLLDEVRIVTGAAMYGGAFTPPTGPFSPTTDVRLTQTSLDQWSAGTPDMQLTQVLVEQWAEVNVLNPQFILTQALVEQWASVAVTAPANTQARAWIMA